MHKLFCSLLIVGAASSLPLLAQSGSLMPSAPHEVDLAVTYNATRGNGIGGNAFWAQGAAAELSAEAFHGLGAALSFSSARASNLGGTNFNLTTITTVAGPRYTYRTHRLALFGEGLAGQSNAFDSRFSGPQGVADSANSLALQVGGGIDYTLNSRFGIRGLQANWLRTQFPNATTNVQNSLQIGAGIVLRLQH